MFKLFYNTIAACQRPVGPLLSNKCMYVCSLRRDQRYVLASFYSIVTLFRPIIEIVYEVH